MGSGCGNLLWGVGILKKKKKQLLVLILSYSPLKLLQSVHGILFIASWNEWLQISSKGWKLPPHYLLVFGWLHCQTILYVLLKGPSSCRQADVPTCIILVQTLASTNGLSFVHGALLHLAISFSNYISFTYCIKLCCFHNYKFLILVRYTIHLAFLFSF